MVDLKINYIEHLELVLWDTGIENRLTVTRGERGGDYRGKGGRVCRNNYKGHMGNNGGWWETGKGGKEAGMVGRSGGKGRQLYLNNNKIFKK